MTAGADCCDPDRADVSTSGPAAGPAGVKRGSGSVYVAGDTVWCDEVRTAIDDHAPDVVVVNAGEARMQEGDPITMTAADVIATARHSRGRVVAVHMEALNHCVLTRDALAAEVREAGVAVDIPADGAVLRPDADAIGGAHPRRMSNVR